MIIILWEACVSNVLPLTVDFFQLLNFSPLQPDLDLAAPVFFCNFFALCCPDLYSFIPSKFNYRRLLSCRPTVFEGKITAQYKRGNLKFNISSYSQEDLTIPYHSDFFSHPVHLHPNNVPAQYNIFGLFFLLKAFFLSLDTRLQYPQVCNILLRMVLLFLTLSAK